MLTAMPIKVNEINSGLVLRVRDNNVVIEVVKTAPQQYYVVTSDKAGAYVDFQNPENYDCWDFEPVRGTTVNDLINQVKSLLRFYRDEDNA